MTRQETAKVLMFLAEAYRSEISDTEIAIWHSQLEHADADLCAAAAHRIVKTSEFFPPISRFLEVYNAERRARAAKQPALPAEHRERVDAGTFHDGLTALRANLRQPKKREES